MWNGNVILGCSVTRKCGPAGNGVAIAAKRKVLLIRNGNGLSGAGAGNSNMNAGVLLEPRCGHARCAGAVDPNPIGFGRVPRWRKGIVQCLGLGDWPFDQRTLCTVRKPVQDIMSAGRPGNEDSLTLRSVQ